MSLSEQDGPNYKDEDGFIHKKLKVEDTVKQNIIIYFGECLKFINGKEKVLVHCTFGASRSATIVIAYIMWKEKKKFSDALNLTQQKRFIVYPNAGFREQLKLFENK